MLVFNLTNQPVAYRKRVIPPEGSFDFKDLTFIPGRDKALEALKVLSFGARPKGWKSAKEVALSAPAKVAKPAPAPILAKMAEKVEADPTEPAREEIKVEEKVDFGMKKKKY